VNPLKRDIEELKELYRRYSSLHESKDPVGDLEKIKEYVRELDPEFLHKEIETLINGMDEGASRTKQIVMDLRNFSRMDEDEFKKTDIHEGLESTLMLLKNKLKNRITVVKEYGNLPQIECIPGKINQVFMNVLNNAAEAIPGEGTIVIRTSYEPKTNTSAIVIKDDGIGMSLAVSRRIFEPFYTTKGIGQGTGLGLSISYGIIEKHKGTIQAKSEKGHGSEFMITLPVDQTSKSI
jgi:signal transduction histidine kinase